MLFPVFANGAMTLQGRRVRCAVGRGGTCEAAVKREGDGRTPAGLWPIRRLLWRPDRRAAPCSALPARPLAPDDGWCDDPLAADYNRPVRLPHPARAERLWREDGLYDVVVILGYNDDPVVAGAGSAIFLHRVRPDFGPTEGCIALADEDLDTFLALAAPGDFLQVMA